MSLSYERQTVDVTAIVVTYNRDDALKLTLECLLKQDPAAREIIVVDQSQRHNSTTQKFLDEIIKQKKIRYIFQSEPNAQRARNRAIAEARGEVLLFIDDDVSMNEELVGAHWKNYGDPTLGAVCGFFTEPGEEGAEQLPGDYKDPITGWLYFPHTYTKRIECHLIPSGNGSIRRELAVQVGGFDENFTYTHFDDTDFSCRLKKLGIKAVHDPEARLLHLREITGGKRPGSVNQFVIADSNRWYIWCYFFWMNFRWRGRREIGRRLRGCVFRQQNMLRPWYLAVASWHFLKGAARAVKAIQGGRKLGVRALIEEQRVDSSQQKKGDSEKLPTQDESIAVDSQLVSLQRS